MTSWRTASAVIGSTVILCSCTAIAPPIPTPGSVGEGCKNVDCVIDQVDAHIKSTDGQYHNRRMQWMDGYDEVSIKELKQMKRLEINEINPLMFGTIAVGTSAIGVPILLPGFAKVYAGDYGDIYRCEVYYLPSSGYHWLVHELQHCAGYKDSTPDPITVFFDDYMPGQKYCMEVEGVDTWEETSIHRLYKQGGWDALVKNMEQPE